MMHGRRNGLVWLLVAVLVVGIFVLDCFTPLGYQDCVLYFVPLLLTAWAKEKLYPVFLATICTILIIIGFFVSPKGVNPSVDIVNRIMGMAVVWVATVLLVQRQRATDELERSEKQMRALAARLQNVREEERTRIARELHDELGQAMTGLKMDLAWAGKQLVKPDPQVRTAMGKRITEMTELVDGTIQSVRRISSELRPGLLDDLGLVAAIEWQAQDFQSRSGIVCEVTLPSDDVNLNRETSTAVFRVFQEIVTNVARHAKATKVKASMRREGDHVILEVSDNGRGITESEIADRRSLGLVGMRERAVLFGGKIKFTGAPGQGTTVVVAIPLQQAGSNENTDRR